MTDTRLAALEAVAEAARVQHEVYGACHVLIVALRALDALPAQPQGETVTLGLVRGRLSGRWAACQEPKQEDPRDWQHVGNISFVPPPDPVVPTIPATVTLPLNTEGGA